MHPRAGFAFFLGLAVLTAGACGGGSTNPDTGPPSDATGLDGEVCFPLPDDEDSDGINDTHEGAPNADSDHDGTPDFRDDDSDADGLSDAQEAGDDNLCSEPRDTDGDGVPDFRELDSDDNGIPDAEEPDRDLDENGWKDFQDMDDDGDNLYDREEMGDDPANPINFDGDELPDYLDTDSDNDGVPDANEGRLDSDGDTIPNYHDLDSDGDEIPDTIEAGENPLQPVDSEGDRIPDYLDTDSDNDGLSDGQEDVNHNGIHEANLGESDAHNENTDGDEFPDLVEWAADTDPNDPGSGLSDHDFYFVLEYMGATVNDDLEFSTDILKADVFFQTDNTGSMGGVITTLKDSLAEIDDALMLEITNVALGAGLFRDFPCCQTGPSFGGRLGGSCPGHAAYDEPFRLTQRITTVLADAQAGVDFYCADGGADLPESHLEALYQAITGEGVSWTVGFPGAVPKFDPMVGFDETKGHGVLGGAGFRVGALPIIVTATDVDFHEANDYWDAGIDQAASRDEVVLAAQALGARLIGIVCDDCWEGPAARAQQEQLARDTNAVVPPTAWGPAETMCHTGVDGLLRPPDPSGLCPLVFGMGANGSGVDVQVVDAIEALVTYGTIDINAVQVSDPYELPEVDTSAFIRNINPVPPEPPGSTIEDGYFRNVQPGAPVLFTVEARNEIVPQAREAQLFLVKIRVMGDDVTQLDERDVYVIVPGDQLVK